MSGSDHSVSGAPAGDALTRIDSVKTEIPMQKIKPSTDLPI